MRDIGRATGIAAVGAGALAGACVAARGAPLSALVAWGTLAALGFATTTAALAPAPGRRVAGGTVLGGTVVGVGSAMLVSGPALAAGAALTVLAVLAARRPGLERGLGPVVSGAPLFYGALAQGRPADGVVPWVLITWLFGVRALVRPGPDARARGWRGWSAAALALAFVPASLVLPAYRGYSEFYFLPVLFADLALLALATRVLVGRGDGVSWLASMAIGVSVLALVAGRVL